MAVNLSSVLSWVSREVVDAPEPLVLLVLGALFLVLSFRVRARRDVQASTQVETAAPRTVVPVAAGPRPQLAPATTALAAQDAR